MGRRPTHGTTESRAVKKSLIYFPSNIYEVAELLLEMPSFTCISPSSSKGHKTLAPSSPWNPRAVTWKERRCSFLSVRESEFCCLWLYQRAILSLALGSLPTYLAGNVYNSLSFGIRTVAQSLPCSQPL